MWSPAGPGGFHDTVRVSVSLAGETAAAVVSLNLPVPRRADTIPVQVVFRPRMGFERLSDNLQDEAMNAGVIEIDLEAGEGHVADMGALGAFLASFDEETFDQPIVTVRFAAGSDEQRWQALATEIATRLV
jgi:hypothetical protein